MLGNSKLQYLTPSKWEQAGLLPNWDTYCFPPLKTTFNPSVCISIVSHQVSFSFFHLCWIDFRNAVKVLNIPLILFGNPSVLFLLYLVRFGQIVFFLDGQHIVKRLIYSNPKTASTDQFIDRSLVLQERIFVPHEKNLYFSVVFSQTFLKWKHLSSALHLLQILQSPLKEKSASSSQIFMRRCGWRRRSPCSDRDRCTTTIKGRSTRSQLWADPGAAQRRSTKEGQGG